MTAATPPVKEDELEDRGSSSEYGLQEHLSITKAVCEGLRFQEWGSFFLLTFFSAKQRSLAQPHSIAILMSQFLESKGWLMGFSSRASSIGQLINVFPEANRKQ